MKALRASRMLVVSIFIMGMFCMQVQANVTYRFTHIVEPQDGPDELGDGAIGEAQLFVDVIDIGGNQVLFNFRNTGPEPCVIKGVYFDDGSLLGIASIINNPGVSFTQNSVNPVNPPELPAAQNLVPVFVTTANFLADADNPAGTNKNGVDPYESLGIVFDLQTTPVIKQFSDVLNDLNNGELRIGLHVGSFDPEGRNNSETFVNDGSVPAPGAIVLGSIGVALVGWLRRQRGF